MTHVHANQDVVTDELGLFLNKHNLKFNSAGVIEIIKPKRVRKTIMKPIIQENPLDNATMTADNANKRQKKAIIGVVELDNSSNGIDFAIIDADTGFLF